MKDLEYLQVDKRQFLAIVTSSSPVKVYEVNGSSFSLFQTLSVSANSSAVKGFRMNDRQYLIVANSKQSKLYCWNSTSQFFEKFQDIGTRGAVYVEYVYIHSFHLLLFSCYSYGGHVNVPSFVYIWSDNLEQFLLYQYLLITGGLRSSTLSTSSGTFVSVYSSYQTNSNSIVFKWNGTYFDRLQSFESSPSYIFEAGLYTFIVSLNTVYRYDLVSGRFTHHSTLPNQLDTTGRYEYFTINTEHYLAVSHRSSSTSNGSTSGDVVVVYRLVGVDFVVHQRVAAPGREVLGLHAFEVNEREKVLAVTSRDAAMSLYKWTHQ